MPRIDWISPLSLLLTISVPFSADTSALLHISFFRKTWAWVLSITTFGFALWAPHSYMYHLFHRQHCGVPLVSTLSLLIIQMLHITNIISVLSFCPLNCCSHVATPGFSIKTHTRLTKPMFSTLPLSREAIFYGVMDVGHRSCLIRYSCVRYSQPSHG